MAAGARAGVQVVAGVDADSNAVVVGDVIPVVAGVVVVAPKPAGEEGWKVAESMVPLSGGDNFRERTAFGLRERSETAAAGEEEGVL